MIFNRERNKVRVLTRKLFRNYEKEITTNAKTNPNLFLQYANPKAKTRIGVAQLVSDGDYNCKNPKLTETDAEKTEILSDYFSSVFIHEPRGEIPTLPNKHVKNTLGKVNITEKKQE